VDRLPTVDAVWFTVCYVTRLLRLRWTLVTVLHTVGLVGLTFALPVTHGLVTTLRLPRYGCVTVVPTIYGRIPTLLLTTVGYGYPVDGAIVI